MSDEELEWETSAERQEMLNEIMTNVRELEYQDMQLVYCICVFMDLLPKEKLKELDEISDIRDKLLHIIKMAGEELRERWFRTE